MTLTAADQSIRKGRITASVAADILHEGQFGTELTAWLSIMDLPREDIGKKNNVKAGHYFEQGICDWWQDEIGTPNGLHIGGPLSTVVHPVHNWLAATPDRPVFNAAGEMVAVLQAKNRSLWALEEFLDRDTRELTMPDAVKIQEQIELEVMNLPRAYVAAVIGGNQPSFTSIDRDPKFAADCIAILGPWHKRYVVGNVQPPPTGKECDTRAFKYLHPEDNGSIVSLSAEAVAAVLKIRELIEQVEPLDEEVERLKNVLRAEIGDATFGEGPGVRLSWKRDRRGVRALTGIKE